MERLVICKYKRGDALIVVRERENARTYEDDDYSAQQLTATPRDTPTSRSRRLTNYFSFERRLMSLLLLYREVRASFFLFISGSRTSSLPTRRLGLLVHGYSQMYTLLRMQISRKRETIRAGLMFQPMTYKRSLLFSSQNAVACKRFPCRSDRVASTRTYATSRSRHSRSREKNRSGRFPHA